MSEPVDRKTIQDALIYGHPPLYAHPAPAPAEHTAEKKIGCVQHDCDECQQREKIAAVGVPDVDRLIKELSKLAHNLLVLYSLDHTSKLTQEAADALATLQSQLAKRDNWLSPETVREHYLPLPELVGYENTIAQQDERIRNVLERTK